MSNALLSKNSNYEPMKQQTKSSRSALEPQGQPLGEVVCYYCHKPRHTHLECRKLLNQNRRFQSRHVASTSNTLEQSVVLYADEYAKILKPSYAFCRRVLVTLVVGRGFKLQVRDVCFCLEGNHILPLFFIFSY